MIEMRKWFGLGKGVVKTESTLRLKEKVMQAVCLTTVCWYAGSWWTRNSRFDYRDGWRSTMERPQHSKPVMRKTNAVR